MCFMEGGGQRSVVKDHIFIFWDPSLSYIVLFFYLAQLEYVTSPPQGLE